MFLNKFVLEIWNSYYLLHFSENKFIYPFVKLIKLLEKKIPEIVPKCYDLLNCIDFRVLCEKLAIGRLFAIQPAQCTKVLTQPLGPHVWENPGCRLIHPSRVSENIRCSYIYIPTLSLRFTPGRVVYESRFRRFLRGGIENFIGAEGDKGF